MLHLRPTWKNLVVAFACCAFARASYGGPGRDEAVRLDRMPEQLRVVAQADTLAALIARLKPTLVFNRRDMLWAGVDEDGLPVFTVARAHLLGVAGREPTWVVLEYRPEATRAIEFSSDYLRETIPLTPHIPVHDPGPGDYAVILSRRPPSGTVYHIGWESGPAGQGLWIEGRRLFILRDRAGWRFVGEGPGALSGRGSGQDVRFEADWTGDFMAPVAIRYTISRAWTPRNEEEWAFPPLVIRSDGVLRGNPALARETAANYFVMDKDDTLEGLVSPIAYWSDIYAYFDDPAGRPRREALVRQRLRALNPGENFESLKEHSRLRVPDPHEIRRDAAAQQAASRAAPRAAPSMPAAPSTRPAERR